MRVRLRATGKIVTIRAEEFDPALHVRLEEITLSLPMQTRAAPVRAETWNAEARTIDVTFSTGAQVRRWDALTDEEWLEELSLEADAIDLSELNDGAPVLNVHWRYDLEDVLGVVERGWLEDVDGVRVGAATLRYSERESIAGIVGDIGAGIIRKVSVGYSVERYEEVTPEGADLRVFRAVAWTPREISNVPIGADPGAGTRAAAPGVPRTAPCIVSRAIPAPREEREETMKVRVIATGAIIEIRAEDFDETIHSRDLTGGTPPAQPDAAALEAARTEGAEQERERQQGIRGAVRAAGLEESVAERMIGRPDLTLDGARAEVLDLLAREDERTATRSAAAIPLGGLDEDVTRRGAIESALLHRYAPDVYAVSEAGREWVGLSLMEIARSLLEAHGEPTRGLSKLRIVERALLTGSDLPAVVENVANKTLRDAYVGAPRSFTAWARRATLPDFKPASRVQFGSVPALEAVGTGGEFHYAAVADSKEVYALLTYGRIVAITRQVIVNDDLDAMTRIPQLYGRGAADLESNLVYTILTSNPNMSDGNPLFDDTNHGNYTTTGTAIAIASLGVARAKMRLQRGLNADAILNLAPQSLIVPAALETLAQQMTAPVNQKLTFKKSEEINPFAGTLDPIVEPRLDAASATAWYLAADSAQCDTIEYGYLEGQEGVYMENRVGFNVDGVEMKARLDFGAKAIDWRGLYKNDGA